MIRPTITLLAALALSLSGLAYADTEVAAPAHGTPVEAVAALPTPVPPAPPPILGSPFASPTHRQRAEHGRGGQAFQQVSFNEAGQGLPAGAIGILVRDVNHQPLANFPVSLTITHQSIAEGNDAKTQNQLTDAQGRTGYVGQSTDSSYRYEVKAEYAGVKYTSGEFQLKRDVGQVAALTIFPSTEKIDEAFVFTRALYVVQPRDDVFEIQLLVRFHNTSPVAWIARDLAFQLPPEAKAFKPGETSGDLKVRLDSGRALLSGSITPGQHETMFTFHVPNRRFASANFRFPVPPHLVDARVYTEASPTTAISVEGFSAATETRGKDGQRALLVADDFLRRDGSPAVVALTITGLPTRGYASWVAAVLAAGLVLLGVSFAAAKDPTTALQMTDRKRARDLLVAELAVLERAYRREEIGPKTYEQTRRILIDALARLDEAPVASASAPVSAV
jgi:hypothetical protein